MVMRRFEVQEPDGKRFLIKEELSPCYNSAAAIDRLYKTSTCLTEAQSETVAALSIVAGTYIQRGGGGEYFVIGRMWRAWAL
jgi:hypothetical protein